jgi:5-methylcytosine-specific restriction endonuclease McrBC GTP-binding regulatory subunit McrB
MYQQSLIEDLNDIPQSSDAQFKFVTFHQSFSYEDFIEGIRPTLDDTEESKIVYKVKDGIFKEICKKASLDPDKNYVLIIDEINRGNISKIFGELITLLEDNKRAGEKEAITVRLPYSGQDFSVPNNVYIIGTMNSTDKSIALVDVALRRRFHFERVNIRNDLIKNEDANKFLSGLNGMIRAIKNPDFEIGHSYFMDIPKNDEGYQELRKIFKNKILPLIEEYFFNDWEALATILGTDSIRVEKRKKLVWDEDLGEFKKESEEFDRLSGRFIDYNKDIFENTRKNLENQQTSLEINKIT